MNLRNKNAEIEPNPNVLTSARRLPSKSVYVYNQQQKPEEQQTAHENFKSSLNLKLDLGPNFNSNNIPTSMAAYST